MRPVDLVDSTLARVCRLVTDGTHDTPRPLSSGYPLIKAKEIVGGRIDFEKCALISQEEHLKVIARSKPEKGDTLFAHIGASLGEAAFVNTVREFSIKNIALFKPDPDIMCGRYLYYLTISPRFQQLAKSTRTGSAQPFLSLNHLRNHPIRFHKHIGDQRRVAAILSAYDDLIENNDRRIRILDEMAQLIYREWFVNFRFPGHENVSMVDSQVGRIPEGWGARAVGDFGAVITGMTPSKKRSEYYGDYMPFVKTPDMLGNIFVIRSKEHLSQQGADSQENKTLPPDALCVTCIGTPGVVSITGQVSQTNQQINSVVLDDATHREFLYFSLVAMRETIASYGAVGATMSNLSKGKFVALPVISPEAKIVRRFHDIASPLFDEIKALQKQNSNLQATRDLLLPKLITGEMDVSELDVDIEENTA